MTLFPRCLFLVLLPVCWADFARIPLHFEANRGQFRKPARFVADGFLLAAAEAQFLLGADRVIGMRVDGGNPAAAMDGIDKLPGESNYFLGGDPQHWRAHVPHFARVRVEEVYPGIDLIYYGKDRQLEFDFVVAPGADPRAIRLAFDGVRRTVEGRFRIDRENRAGFAVSHYDVSRPLIIDPVLSCSTLLTSSSSVGDGIAIDAAGNTYLTGNANSGFLTVSDLQPAFGAGRAAFVAKFNAAGTVLLYSTLLGGSVTESGAAPTTRGLRSPLIAPVAPTLPTAPMQSTSPSPPAPRSL